MNKIEIKKLKNLGFLEDEEICTIYGQEVIDRFISLLVNKLKKEGFKHYNGKFLLNDKKRKYYRIIDNKLELMSNVSNINHEALDIQYFFSKFLKDTLGISLIEGFKEKNKHKYYYGYIYISSLRKMYEIQQDDFKVFLKFDVFNIFYSILKDDSFLSYLITPYLSIIPLHQNKSGVLSYAHKVKEKINFECFLDDNAYSPIEKKKNSISKRIPLIIYIGPKEVKKKNIIVEFNNQKNIVDFDELNTINEYLINSLKVKYNTNLRDVYFFEKEIVNLNNFSKIIKANICPNCRIENYKYFLTPFNRISKSNKCIVCQKEVNNIILLKK